MADSVWVTVVVPLAMFLMMLGLGTTLTPAALAQAVKRRRPLTIGLIAQIILVPMCAAIVVCLVDMPAEFKLGLMLLACCPGGTSSNLFCHLGKGNLALSIALTTFSSLAVLLTMPLILQVSASVIFTSGFAIDIPQLEILKRLFFMTLLPIGVGIALAHKWPAAGEKIARATGPFGLAFLMALTATIVVSEWDKLLHYLPILGSTILAFSGLILVSTGLIMIRQISDHRDRFTLFVEASIQSSALSMFIALTVLENGSMIAIPSGMYSLSMYMVGFLLVAYHRYKDRSANMTPRSANAR